MTRGLLYASCIPPLVAVFFLGLPILNLLRGIANEGYTVKTAAVYMDGKPIAGADPASFEVVELTPETVMWDYDARDKHRRYRDGKALP